MPGASLRYEKESFESLFRRWKRAVERAGTLQEITKHEFYEKHSAIKKRQKTEAKKRNQRMVQIEKLRMASKKRPLQKKKASKKDRKRQERSNIFIN